MGFDFFPPQRNDPIISFYTTLQVYLDIKYSYIFCEFLKR